MFFNLKLNKNACILFWIILGIFLFLPSIVRADASVQFHGTLIAANCSPESASVEFGDVSLDKIPSFKSAIRSHKQVMETQTYAKVFPIKINCTGDVSDITYKWTGNVTDALYLATDMSGLVIALANNESKTTVIPDVWLPAEANMIADQQIEFLATLMKDSTATFEGGEFNAVATIALQLP
ncbi:type 1 fimbrial protein [Enterobacter kobei]|nr:type 1 fimbrial protein [Enterobacter kobei]